MDFEANAREGIAVDWPIRYHDLAGRERHWLPVNTLEQWRVKFRVQGMATTAAATAEEPFAGQGNGFTGFTAGKPVLINRWFHHDDPSNHP